MYQVELYDGRSFVVCADNFYMLSEHNALVFTDSSGNQIGYYDKKSVISVFKTGDGINSSSPVKAINQIYS